MIKVLLADDHPIMLDGLELIFEGEEDIEIVERVTSAPAIHNYLKTCEQQVDIVFTDIKMPDLDEGLEIAEKIIQSKKYPQTHILFYSIRIDEAAVGKAIKMGAQGYLDKGCSGEEILSAIRTVAHNGESFFSEDVKKIVPAAIELMNNMPSAREREILTYLERGMKAEEIAKELFISVHTVRDHCKNLREKYGASNTPELLYILKQKGII
ncbi:MAG: response regulator transcription factor [Bacteroidota bacterium]